jgi:hypothetical protein
MRGITLKEDDTLVAADLVRPQGELLLVTAVGYAKRTPLGEFSPQGRGGAGIVAIDITKTKLTGPLVDARVVSPGDQVALVTSIGGSHSLAVADVPALPRDSWGRLVSASRRYAVVQLKDETVVRCVRLEGTKPAGVDKAQPARAGHGGEHPPAARKAAPVAEPQAATTAAPAKPAKTAKKEQTAPAPASKPVAAPDTPADQAPTATATPPRTRRTTVSKPPERKPARKGEA